MSSARSIIYVVLTIFVGATLSFAQGPAAGSNNKPEDQVTQVERDWLAADAKGDAASLRRIIAEGFIGSTFDGGLVGKEDIIPQGTGPGGFAGATPGETNVRVFGDTGVLMGVINTAGGAQAKQIHVTLVCQKSAQGWQIIAAQLTQVN
jgi:ketosteroid isomerase-like protein